MADASFDGANLTITLPTSQTSVDCQRDIYSAWKRWVQTTGHQYEPAFDVTGGDPINATDDLAPAFFLRNDLGWRIKPDEEDITINIIGNLYPRDADVEYITTTTGAFTVLVNVDRSQNALRVNDLSAAELEASLVTVLTTNTETELSSVPAASPDLHAMIQFIYMWIRNEVTQNGTTTTLKTDAGATLGTGTTSETGGTVTKGKLS
jgi:hypothetical protein